MRRPPSQADSILLLGWLSCCCTRCTRGTRPEASRDVGRCRRLSTFHPLRRFMIPLCTRGEAGASRADVGRVSLLQHDDSALATGAERSARAARPCAIPCPTMCRHRLPLAATAARSDPFPRASRSRFAGRSRPPLCPPRRAAPSGGRQALRRLARQPQRPAAPSRGERFFAFFRPSMVGRGRPIRPSLRPLRCLAALVWLRWPRPRRLRLLRIARTDAVRFDLCPASADTLSIVLIFLLGRAWVADSLLHLLRVHAAVCARDGGGA